MHYTQSPYKYYRRLTSEVGFGIIKLGGVHPIRVESMTTTDTMNTAATVEQCQRLFEAGCEIIRITAPSMKEAENLGEISKRLRSLNINTPLVADIHFTPNAALKAAEFVENVRVNPGNYADKKKFAVREYTDSEYQEELERIYKEFKPLVLKCKDLGRSIRIGTNHGSLSDRIMNRYGDSPLGMVESALEFARICEDCGYYDFLFSMKSSNPLVMIQAYRLLVNRADKELKHKYPLHLGVTEAGNSEEGRVKSAIGIGSLLEDGLGDTIRVSLTEDPVNEVAVGFEIVRRYNERWLLKHENQLTVVSELIKPDHLKESEVEVSYNPFEFSRRVSKKFSISSFEIGGDAPPRVELHIKTPLLKMDEVRDEIIFSAKPFLKDGAKSELVSISTDSIDEVFEIQKLLFEKLIKIPISVTTSEPLSAKALIDKVEKVTLLIKEGERFDLSDLEYYSGSGCIEFCFIQQEASDRAVAEILTKIALKCQKMKIEKVLFSILSENLIYPYRRLAYSFHTNGIHYPIVLRYNSKKVKSSSIKIPESTSDLNTVVAASIQFGSLLSDGIGDILSFESNMLRGDELNLVYNILQATRYRMTKTEYISCPSCGRTLFDLEEVTAKIKARTSHLKGVKIGIMGCIVNGPGEMADADFGYVGTGIAQISLYVGKEVVERNIPENEAVDRLIDLIKRNGKWKEPKEIDTEIEA